MENMKVQWISSRQKEECQKKNAIDKKLYYFDVKDTDEKCSYVIERFFNDSVLSIVSNKNFLENLESITNEDFELLDYDVVDDLVEL